MLDRQYLADLIPILKLHGVKQIKMQGLELVFHVEQSGGINAGSNPASGYDTIGTEDPNRSTQAIVDAFKKQEEALPPDLRADSLMDQDKILNWSSPDQKPFDEEPELPLTGEAPL